MNENWYDRSVEQIEHRFGTDRGAGLSRADVQKARREYGQNNVYPTPTSGFSGYRSHIFFDFASLLLFVAALLASVFGLPEASGAIIILLVINHAASVFTFLKAQRVLEGMAAYSLPTAKIMRDGKLGLIDMRALVPGDVVFLSAGDIVPADCRLFMSDNLFVNEAIITGKVNSVRKDAAFTRFSPGLPLSERANMVYAATIVTAGNGRAIVVATGKDTVAASEKKTRPVVTHENLKVLAKLRVACSKLSLIMLSLIFLITLAGMFLRHGDTGLFDIFLTGSALAAASMSELFTAFGYIMIGCGVFSAMKRRKDINTGALIKNAEKLEALREVDCLIVPKDGILTISHSVAEKIYVPRRLYGANDRDRIDRLRSVVLCGVISTGIYGAGLSELNSSSRKITPEEEALIELADKLGIYNSSIDRDHPIIEHMPAGGASRFDTTLTLDTDKKYLAICRGEAQAILERCEYYAENGQLYRMTTPDRLDFLGTAESLIKSSYKVLALATGMTGYNNLRRVGAIQSDLTFEGFIALREPLETGVAQVIARAQAAGIKVILTTERYTESDKYLAISTGIIAGEKEILTESRRLSYSRDMLRVNLPLYNMYCGIPAAGLAEIVSMLRADGAKVGLLAGGINGALLLKCADVGFAQSVTISPKAKRGTVDIRSRSTPAYSRITGSYGHTFDSEALKFISDVVVSDADKRGDGGFAAVVSALEYSRSIWRNMLRMLRYLVTVNLTRIFLILGSTILRSLASRTAVSVSGTLTPAQIVFSGLIVDLAAVITIAFAKPSHDALTLKDDVAHALDHPISSNIRPFFFALFEAFVLLAAGPVSERLGFPLGGSLSCTLFMAFTLFQLITLTEYESERSVFAGNLRVNMIQAVMMLGLVVFFGAGMLFPVLGDAFGITVPGTAGIVVTAVLTFISVFLHEVYKLAAGEKRRLGKKRSESEKEPESAPAQKQRSRQDTFRDLEDILSGDNGGKPAEKSRSGTETAQKDENASTSGNQSRHGEDDSAYRKDSPPDENAESADEDADAENGAPKALPPPNNSAGDDNP